MMQNSLARKGTQRLDCSEDRVAAQWRKSAKAGFSRGCCQGATPVPLLLEGSREQSALHYRQLEAIGFTQSWIVVVHFSLAGVPAELGRTQL